MKPREAPYKELTDPKNERITATLNSRAWAKLTVLATRSAFFSQTLEGKDWENPQDKLIHEARQSSGSIKGQHRKDLVDAMQGVRQGKEGVSMGGPLDPMDDGGL